MPIGIPIALGVLALLALLALACNCLAEVPAPPTHALQTSPVLAAPPPHTALCAPRPGNPNGGPAARGGGTFALEMTCSLYPFKARMSGNWEPSPQSPARYSCLPLHPSRDPQLWIREE